MSIKLTTLGMAPPVAHGLVRDLRIRWALEEVGLPYEVELIDFATLKSEGFRKRQPFQQVPVYEEEGLVLFESGAILLHVAGRSEKLLPGEPGARSRAIAWIFSALNSVEPPLNQLVTVDLFQNDEDWSSEARPSILEAAERRFTALESYLDGREFLEDRFTAGDLMMTTVLRIPRHCELLKGYPNLDAYRHRNEQRPAFQKALNDQLKVYQATTF